MDQGFMVKHAGELMDEEFTAKWRNRQALDPLPRVILATILEQLVATGQPVPVHVIERELVLQEPAGLRPAIADLDAKDLILVEDDQVVLAYPSRRGRLPFGWSFPTGASGTPSGRLIDIAVCFLALAFTKPCSAWSAVLVLGLAVMLGVV